MLIDLAQSKYLTSFQGSLNNNKFLWPSKRWNFLRPFVVAPLSCLRWWIPKEKLSLSNFWLKTMPGFAWLCLSKNNKSLKRERPFHHKRLQTKILDQKSGPTKKMRWWSSCFWADDVIRIFEIKSFFWWRHSVPFWWEFPGKADRRLDARTPVRKKNSFFFSPSTSLASSRLLKGVF